MKKICLLMAAATLPLFVSPAEAGGKKDKAAALSDELKTLTFRRPFVVPVGNEVRTTGMVVVSFNVEIVDGNLIKVQEYEDLLRDRILSALMELSHGGTFDSGITDPQISVLIKETVRETIEKIYPESVGEVFIQDLLSRRVL